MFSLFGPELSIKNAYLLGRRFMGNRTLSHTRDLKPYYLDFLAEHQPRLPLNRGAEPFITDPRAEELLKDAYRASSLNDLKQQRIIGDSFDAPERERLIALVREGYAQLSSANPALQAVFDLAIHSVFFRRSTRTDAGAVSFGGSSSTAMGAIWVSGHGKQTKHDVAEFLLHELTHHLLFLSERCLPQFHYREMIKPENYAQSAILNKRRPLDKVVHSVVVSTELLLARRSFLRGAAVTIHPDSPTMTARSLRSIDEVLSLSNRDAVITPWTVELLERCREALKPVEVSS